MADESQNGTSLISPGRGNYPAPRHEDEDIIKDMSLNNGLKYHQLIKGGHENVKLIEMFFGGFPRIVGMRYMPNLTTLILMGQPISKISGLDPLTKLKELWICESQLKTIDGLEHNKKLTRLYLYTNQITRIQGLSHLKDLEVLWLANNHIANVEGLNDLNWLRELNLSGNRIEKIGHALDAHAKLESLNLSGNNICSFKDLTYLVRIPRLKVLGLKDPLYAPNPVCFLCNYSTHVLYHIPQLERLDSYDVSNKTLREMAETTVMKKKMYYNMRVKTLKRNMADMIQQLGRERRALTRGIRERLKTLSFAIKEVEKVAGEINNNNSKGGSRSKNPAAKSMEDELDDEEEYDPHGSGTESDGQQEQETNGDKLNRLQGKIAALQDRRTQCGETYRKFNQYYNEAVSQVKHSTDVATKRLLTELETGGNVRFEDGNSNDVWFTSCHDLILSRFCAADYKQDGIMGIKIHRITRVHNRMLRYRFDHKLATITDEDDSPAMARNSSIKKLQEYLFFIWDPELPGGENQPMKILEEGPMDVETYAQLGRCGAVPLANSVGISDTPRMKYLVKKAQQEPCSDPCPFRCGQLVVCKVYLGKSLPAMDAKLPIKREFYPNADSVFRPKQFSVSDKEKEGICECVTRQCEWFVFDHELVLPEYVIDFEYVTKEKPPSPFLNVEDMKPGERKRNLVRAYDPKDDDDVLKLKPEIQPRPRLVALTEDLLLKFGKAPTLSTITVLNLHGNGLTKLKNINSLTSLQRLTVSFNDLCKLDDIGHMQQLEYVDASFNKLYTLDGLRGMSKLKTLDLSWNDLTNTRDDLSILRKHSPSLTCLDLRHNNWQKPEGLRLRTIGRLKSLSTLDGQPVTESEATAALRMAAGSRISQVSLLAHTRTDTVRPRSLNLASCAQLLTQISRNKPDRLSENDSQWYSLVTTLNLDSQHISKLSNLERLVNLRWASFNDNDLTKVEGLDNCTQLEELSLEDNCIYKVEGLLKLTKLHTLNLSTNNLATLEGAGLDKLARLQCLSVENNRISSLAGLGQVASLLELYIGNNNIKNIREIFQLKQLPNFVILDLCGNPVATEADNYRLFVVYHLKTLKALDGLAVESSEGGTAKDTFGGRLTQDFVAEKLGHSNFHEVRELDFPQNGLRMVDLGSGEHFINLRSVNLEHNNLTSFSGLVYLLNLRVLCLNHNHVECIVPKKGKKSNKDHSSDMFSANNFTPLLENLEVLHLGYNGIGDLPKLQLGRLPSLKALFLQGNDISKIEGLEGLQDLRELVVDRNKIKSLNEFSFMNQWNLVELHMEENRMRDLSHFQFLENLQRLYLGSNRLQEMSELEKLESMPNLIELSVISNPVSRRLMHRPMLVFRQPNLLCIDGIPVSPEERTKAELYFMEQQPPSTVTTNPDTTLPGISPFKGQAAPVKITNVQLQGQAAERHGWSTQIQYDEQMGLDHKGNRRQRSYGRGDANANASPNNSSHRFPQGGSTQNYHRPQYQGQHQVPYVPHQNRGHDSHGGHHYSDNHGFSRYSNNSGGKGGRR